MFSRNISRLILPALLAFGTNVGAALAQQCNQKNPPINQVNGGYPSMPANAWTPPNGWSQASTQWSINGAVINLNSSPAPLVKGINYEPTQIGGSADFTTFNDFFYTNDVPPNGTWAPIWDRDIELLRAMGVNTIRTYGWWKWEPVVEKNWQSLNFDVNNESNTPCSGSYPHPTHIPFLDRLWNNGVNPIYVWIGISLPIDLANPNLSPARRAELTQFYKYTTRWAAIKYGNHPAVMGFVIGNEIDESPATTQLSFFWEMLNDFNALVKASAPDKLTMSVFHDGLNPFQTITDQPLKGLTGPQAYKLDVFGDNPYNNPANPGNAIDRYVQYFANCTVPSQGSCVKPMLFTEFGTPADTHATSSDLKKVYPLMWTAPNFVWQSSPPPAMCVASTKAPPPGSGGDGAAIESALKTTIAQELSATPTNGGDPSYTLPAGLASFFTASGVNAGDALAAADQANWIAQFWAQGVIAHQAGVASDRPYVSGGFVFEFRDEWWKSLSPTFQNISGPPDTCTQCPCQRGGNPSAANAVFSGGWGDEEWFGVTGAKVNPNRCPAKGKCTPGQGQNTDPVTGEGGVLNGGPDILRPRASVVALCKAYNGSGCP